MKIKDLPKIDRPREKLEKTIEQFENRNIRTGDGSLVRPGLGRDI